MTKCMLRRAVSTFICIGLLAVVVSACSPHDAQYEAAIEWKRGQFQRLQGNLALPFAQRVQTMPADLLKEVQDSDQAIGIANTDRYLARAASADELALIKTYMELLPSAHRKVITEKLLGLFIVDGFSGAGLTEWVVDRDGHVYYFLILNSALFTSSLDDWLTYKDNSYFDKSAPSPALRVRTQTNYKALMYGLLHEGAHIVDYEFGVTPYFDPQHRELSGRTREVTGFTDGVWMQRSQPGARYDFKHRAELNTYGIFPKMGLVPRSELAGMFSQLTRTPFVSFYSGTSWNEDLADYVTYRHIEKKLGGAVTVELLRDGKVIDRYAPVKTAATKQRERSVRVFCN